MQIPVAPHPPRVGDEQLQDTEESSSPPQSPRRRIYERLLRQTGRHEQQALDSSPSFHAGGLTRHLRRLPCSYISDHLAADKAEDVLLHWRILDECAGPDKRPVFHARFLKCITVRADYDGSDQEPDELYQRLMEDLGSEMVDGNGSMGDLEFFLHEIIFSSLDRPKLLHQLTGLLSDVGLNIREAHVYTTVDGFCLGVFLVDGWGTEEPEELIAKIKETLALKNAPHKRLEILRLNGAC